MKRVIVWSALSILSLVVSYNAGELMGEKLGEAMFNLLAKD